MLLAHDADAAVRDRAAEEVVGAHRDLGVLAGQVELTVGLGVDDVGRQLVAADAEAGEAALVFVRAVGDLDRSRVAAEPRACGDGPVGGGDAEARGAQL